MNIKQQKTYDVFIGFSENISSNHEKLFFFFQFVPQATIIGELIVS